MAPGNAAAFDITHITELLADNVDRLAPLLQVPVKRRVLLGTFVPASGQGTQAANERLWEAARAGDTARITAALADQPIAGAEVDVWHSSPEGRYENQDPGQAEMNLRGRFLTDHKGRFTFRSVKPAGYPVPIDGPVGELMVATSRHNFRPAHLHFMLFKPGFKTLISQIYCPDDPYLASDAQFGVTRALIGDFVRHDAAEGGLGLPAPWYSLDQRFRLEPGEARRPRAPIGAKAAPGAPAVHGLGRADGSS